MKITTALILSILANALSACAPLIFGGLGYTGSQVLFEEEEQAKALNPPLTPAVYINKGIQGPVVIVTLGYVDDGTYQDYVSAEMVKKYAELELGLANFRVLERGDIEPLFKEVRLALNTQDAKGLMLRKERFKTAKYIVNFDILKLGLHAGVWTVGMRYTLIHSNTSEQVSIGYFEEKRALTMPFSSLISDPEGDTNIDALIQRLVQKCVQEIDLLGKKIA